ncbi:hypothetical protein T265_15077, partial [Opisthorchis viverrini]
MRFPDSECVNDLEAPRGQIDLLPRTDCEKLLLGVVVVAAPVVVAAAAVVVATAAAVVVHLIQVLIRVK